MTGQRNTRKLRPPGLAPWVVARPRVDALIRDAFESVDVIEIAAVPGAGKTVATQLFGLRYAWPIAWLNLDVADRSSARLAGYIVQALEPFAQADRTAVDEAFRSGVDPTDVVAHQGERVRAQDLLVVFDNAEEIVDQGEPESILKALIGSLPASARVMLLSRQPMDGMARSLAGRLTRIGSDELALTVAETELLLRASGRPTEEAASLVRATGGWAAGIVFTAAVPSTRTGGDLTGYLNHEILDRLAPDEQELLLRTCMLDTVTESGAATAGLRNGSEVFQRLSRLRLPATVEADGGIVYHPFFRQFLRTTLEERSPELAHSLRRARADQLANDRNYSEGMQLLFDGGDLEEAAELAATAMPALAARGDWPTILQWCDALGPEFEASHPLLLASRLRALPRTRQLSAAQTAIREAHRQGRLTTAVAADAELVAEIGWAFLSHPIDGLALMAAFPATENSNAVAYALRVIGEDAPATPPPLDVDSGVALIARWGLLLQGRFDLLCELQERDATTPAQWTIPGLLTQVWAGRLEDVRSTLDRAPHDVQGLLDYVETLVRLAEGDPDGALRSAEEAVGRSRRARFGWDPFLQLAVGLALIRTDRIPEARALLHDARARAAAANQLAYTEWADVYLGLCSLATGANGAAVQMLRDVVERMEQANRRLQLPAALIYLAEAEVGSGSQLRAGRLARRAMAVATELGAPALIAQALHDTPNVRGLKDVFGMEVAGGDGHDTSVVRHGSEGARRAASAPTEVCRISVQPFGQRPDIWVDGAPCGIRRLKVLELAAYLAVHDGGVSRPQVQLDLFPEHDQRAGSNYFRQITHQFRRLTGIALTHWDADMVGLPVGTVITSADVLLEAAMSTRRTARSEALGGMLEVFDSLDGDFLAASTLPWAERRRFEQRILRRHADRLAAPLALEVGRLDLAERLALRVLADDPSQESALAILVRIAEATSDADHCERLVRQVRATLEELGADEASVAERTAALARLSSPVA